MKTSDARKQGKGGLELIEQAIHLLRGAPPAALASYYLGTLPFMLDLLYFWADMSRSPTASQHLAGAALGLGMLFFWMKFWQVIFARSLRASLASTPLPVLTFQQYVRIFISQATLQPLGLFLLPLALLLTVPFGWAYAFQQNVTVLADGESSALSPLAKKSLRQAALWPAENHAVLAVLLGFGFVIFLNWATVCFLLPFAAKKLFDLNSVFSRGGLSMLNTTFFAAVFGLTYLCVDPLLKAVYVLRCFYGESLQSGEDLKADLRHCVRAEQAAVAGLVLLLTIASLCRDRQIVLSADSATPNGMTHYTNGISALSPGLRGSATLGTGAEESFTLKGFQEKGTTKRWLQPLRGRDVLLHAGTQGSAAAQPWAECWDPFGIIYAGEIRTSVHLAAGSKRGQREALKHWAIVGRPSGTEAQLNFCKTPKTRVCNSALPAHVPAPTEAEKDIRAETPSGLQRSSTPSPSTVSPQELDRTIQEVIQQRKYTWRMPRQKSPELKETQNGPLTRFFQRAAELFRKGSKAFFDWLDKWLRKLLSNQRQTHPTSGAGAGWMTGLYLLLYVVVAAAAIALALLLFRVWRERRRQATAVSTEPIVPAPDLHDENVTPDLLPEDGWMKLARELLEKGELRLAMRAFYLSSLAHLATRNLITLARFKSNRDYERELQRRGHAFPQLLLLFADNVTAFDRTWYGMHETTGELVSRFAQNVERMKTPS